MGGGVGRRRQAGRSSVADVAVCFSGWLNVSIPAAGLEARRKLVDALKADVFVAGTYAAQDCGDAGGNCLLPRLERLRPITRLQLSPMLTLAQLAAAARAAPAFASFASGFKERETYEGVVMFAPVAGNPNVSVMRELHDTSRVLTLVAAHERARGARYSWLVYSRLEFHWVAPHPPLSVLSPDVVWVPSGQNVNGLNDRHAVVPRAAADVYFRRWELLMSADLLRVVPLATLQHVGPEGFLMQVLEHGRVRHGHFPAVAYLSCCNAGGRCFNSFCRGMYSSPSCVTRHAPACLRLATPNGAQRSRADCELIEDATPRRRPPLSSEPSPALSSEPSYRLGARPLTVARELRASSRQRRCAVLRGKYFGEIIDAARHWRFLQCGGTYRRLPAWTQEPWSYPPTVALVVPAGLRAFDPAEAQLTRHVLLDHTAPPRSPLPFGCPLSGARQWAPHSLPVSGYCENTPDHADCARDAMGSWPTRATRASPPIPDLAACVARCRACANCNFVSFSIRHHDCSWYRACPALAAMHAEGAAWRAQNASADGVTRSSASRQGRRKGRGVGGGAGRGIDGSPALPLDLELRALRHIVTGWDYVTVRVRS